MANVYEIPDNFVETGRVLHGMFETKAFIEGCVLGGIGVILGLLIPMGSLQARISELVICGGPGFVIGIMGINGDRVSTTLLNMYRYSKEKKIMFYDNSARALVDAPVDRMMDDVTIGEQILQYIEDKRQEKLEKKLAQQYVIGQNFEFAEDTDYARDYISDEPEEEDSVAFGDEDDVLVFDAEMEEIEADIDEWLDSASEEEIPFVPYIPINGNRNSGSDSEQNDTIISISIPASSFDDDI